MRKREVFTKKNFLGWVMEQNPKRKVGVGIGNCLVATYVKERWNATNVGCGFVSLSFQVNKREYLWTKYTDDLLPEYVQDCILHNSNVRGNIGLIQNFIRQQGWWK